MSLDPSIAQQIVADYGRKLEQHLQADSFPAPLQWLPHPKPLIRTAILTCVHQLAATNALSDDLRDFLETAHVSLADYIDDELVRLLNEYKESAEALTTVVGAPRDRQNTPMWQHVQATSRLAGEIARSMAEEAQSLRQEFQATVSASSAAP